MIELHASSLPRIMACPGFMSLTGDYPPSSHTDDAREGTAAHELFVHCLRNACNADTMIGIALPQSKYIVTDDMANYIDEIIDVNDRRCDGYAEEIVDWSFGSIVVRGRADWIRWENGHEILNIDDLKYGYRIVEPFENWQLLSYAIGECIKATVTPRLVNLTIRQPRPYHSDGPFRTWTITGDELNDYYGRIVNHLSRNSDELVTGPHCYKCEKMAICPAKRLAAFASVDLAFDHAETDNLTPEQISVELDLIGRASEHLKQRQEAIQSLAEHRIKQGTQIPNYEMKPSYGHRAWLDCVTPETAEIMTGANITKPVLLTPRQAKSHGVSDDIINALTDRPFRGYKLERVDLDKKAKKLFAATS